jgi:DNA/RNA endonuclease YhcR with UshA esterase domain
MIHTPLPFRARLAIRAAHMVGLVTFPATEDDGSTRFKLIDMAGGNIEIAYVNSPDEIIDLCERAVVTKRGSFVEIPGIYRRKGTRHHRS